MKTPEPFWFDPFTNFIALLVGAALSYFITWKFEARRERREQKANAFSLVFSIQNICNDLIQLNNILRNISNTRTQEMASGIPLWQLLPISFGWDKEIVLQPAELALLAGTKNHELVTKVQEANSAHRIYTRAANRVGELKLELANSGLAASASGEVIQFEATSAQYAGIAHVINQLEALSEKLGSDLAEATHQAVECGRQVPKVLKDFYKFDHLVGLVFDEIEDSSDDAISHANQ